MKTTILDILFQTFTSPSEAFSELSNRKPLGWAVLTAVFTSIVFSRLPTKELIFDMTQLWKKLKRQSSA